MSEFKTTIGLEIHIQLNTKSKMFCGCSNDAEGAKVNELTCPICMAMPGTLPVANKEAIKKVIKLGLAMGCEINKMSKFDRKHYFYPDLPKGYQISQYDQPFCVGGKISVNEEEIRFNRIHLEEDAGKLVHVKGSNHSIVDLNRAGTPLAEMVTEPDLHSPSQAKQLLQQLHLLVRSLGVSSADMEKGHMRCDANISVERGDQRSAIVEIKNLNSFKFVEKALEVEEKRLTKNFDEFVGKSKITRGFNSAAGTTYQLREKEEAKDYRYFPEPDLPPFYPFEDEDLNPDQIIKEIGELPEAKKNSLVKKGLSEAEAELIVKNNRLQEIINQIEEQKIDIAWAAKLIVNNRKLLEMSDDRIVELLTLAKEEEIPLSKIKALIDNVEDGGTFKESLDLIASDKTDLDSVIDNIIKENNEVVQKYKSGKQQVIGVLVGEVMKLTKGSFGPAEVVDKLKDKMQ